MGALAAIGVVLWARIAAARPAAVAAIAPLGLAVYMTYSRGALGALAAGLVVLLLLAPTWEQLRAVIVGVEGAAIAAIAASRLDDIKSADPSSGQGAVLLAVLLAAIALTVVLNRGATGPLPLPPRARAAGWAVAVAVAAAPFVIAVASERGTPSTPAFGATTARLGSTGSNRYAYWRVAVDTWRDHPIDGAGPASFRAEWLARRPFAETVRDAHSLELETLAELGLVGFGCLALLFGGVISALTRLGGAAAGSTAALAVWAVHSGVDWDWEMPALTLVAIVLAGAALGAAQSLDDGASGQDAERGLGGEAEARGPVREERDDDDHRDGGEHDKALAAQ